MTDADPPSPAESDILPTGALPTAADHPEVKAFLKLHGLGGPARYIDYSGDPYGADWCHVSAKHKALTAGGRRVHGWALWAFGDVVVGDHHSLWQTTGGTLVDVTPPKFGESRVLFVRDDGAPIEGDDRYIYLLTNRTSVPDAKWMWKGNPSEYSHVPCPWTKPDLVEYCALLGISASAIVTDGVHG